MKMLKKALAILTSAAMLCASAALADGISFSGTVTSASTVQVYAPIGGTVEEILKNPGEKVTADDALITLKTTKVYAPASGTVTGVFAVPGDSADTVSSRYGAVMYIEEQVKYTVSASTDDAYNSTATKFVHVGETVYLQSRSDTSRTGTGVITAIEGTGYTVEVDSGTFLLSETCYIYRNEDHKTSHRIGSGTIARKSPTAVTGSGSVVAVAVQDGATVTKGDLLFETLDGTFDGYYMSGSRIYAGVSGTVASVSAQEGGAVQKSSVVASIYPDGAMRVEASVDEDDLSEIAVGDAVTVELEWNEDQEITYPGTITMISAIGESTQTGGVSYTVYIDFTPDENTRYGMSAVITTASAEEETTDETDKETTEETGTESGADTGNSADQQTQMTPPAGGSMPEGMTSPEGMTLPDGVTPPTDGQAPTVTEAPSAQ